MPPTIHFLNRLLTQLSNIQPQTSTEDDQTPPLARIPAAQQQPGLKPLILTLHCLFPNELLPALDILDRGLVKRLATAGSPTTSGDNTTPDIHIPHDDHNQERDTTSETSPDEVFFVTSVSSSAAISTADRQDQKSYEVRLRAWNCTCPAFALLTFREGLSASASMTSGDLDPGIEPGAGIEDDDPLGQDYYGFGGTLTSTPAAPVCKHLLACVLAVRCPGLFGGGYRRVVGRGELGGCCAGWGG
jgi:hypothetical protein